MTDPVVRVVDVTHHYGVGPGAVAALRDVSCTVQPGERIALVGPSGSGKSTLLQLLGNLDQPTAGEITWPTLGLPELLRPTRVVNILQGQSLIVALSVLENVSLPLLLAGYNEADARSLARQALAVFDLVALADRLAEEISGGQAQRVAIVRALAVRPQLILADEPTGQLDSRTAQTVFHQLIASAEEYGAALVVATHDPDIARHLERQWQMTDGRLRTEAPDGNTVQLVSDRPPAMLVDQRGTP